MSPLKKRESGFVDKMPISVLFETLEVYEVWLLLQDELVSRKILARVVSYPRQMFRIAAPHSILTVYT